MNGFLEFDDLIISEKQNGEGVLPQNGQVYESLSWAALAFELITLV